MNDTLKAAGRIGAELGAAKAAVERLREALETCESWFTKHSPTAPLIGGFGDAEHPMITFIRAALSQQAEPVCRFCGKPSGDCDQSFPNPSEPAPAQDERKTFEAWAKTQGDKWLIVGGLQWSAGTDDYASARTNAAWAAWQERAARPAQTAPQGKFRMGDLVKKSTGSEWEGRVVGWYSTEQTPEGYAVESSAHRNSVQIYPAKALEAVE